jgi:hypothetical protein
MVSGQRLDELIRPEGGELLRHSPEPSPEDHPLLRRCKLASALAATGGRQRASAVMVVGA